MYKKVKRVIDFILALIMILIFSPVMLFISILIEITDGKPAIFKQKRPGKDAKIFTLYKFRTMTTQLKKNGRTLNDIERVTKLGKFLRKTSLDELPQLFNILKGDMSFIGPRPLLVRYLPYYTKQQMRRHEVTPGISGLAQVSGRNSISWQQKFELDLWYVDNMSFKLDLKIFFMTIAKILKRDGVNSSDDNIMNYFDEEVEKNKKDEKF